MREKIYRFMQGRYGWDSFSKFLIGFALALEVFNLFIRNHFINTFCLILLIYAYFRCFSKNISARYEENQRYMKLASGFHNWFLREKKLMEERKYHHIYTCPKCKQKIRIPRGKGKIMVRCPKCYYEFPKRS